MSEFSQFDPTSRRYHVRSTSPNKGLGREQGSRNNYDDTGREIPTCTETTDELIDRAFASCGLLLCARAEGRGGSSRLGDSKHGRCSPPTNSPVFPGRRWRHLNPQRHNSEIYANATVAQIRELGRISVGIQPISWPTAAYGVISFLLNEQPMIPPDAQIHSEWAKYSLLSQKKKHDDLTQI
jgi:hypothetical protein